MLLRKQGATAGLPSGAKRVHGAHCWASQQRHTRIGTIVATKAYVTNAVPDGALDLLYYGPRLKALRMTIRGLLIIPSGSLPLRERVREG
jgi:hypothetical protein